MFTNTYMCVYVLLKNHWHLISHYTIQLFPFRIALNSIGVKASLHSLAPAQNHVQN